MLMLGIIHGGCGESSALLAKQTADVDQSCLDVNVMLPQASEIDGVSSGVALKCRSGCGFLSKFDKVQKGVTQ